MKFFNTEISKGNIHLPYLDSKVIQKLSFNNGVSLCLRFGNQRNGDLFIKLQRWHRKVGAGNTTAFPNLFNKQRIKEHTTQASSSILSFYIGSGRIHADIFWYKIENW